ncbi:SPOR domain-containing protein [Sphingopyxis alaskensis]|jgi:Flp pilus assembly protein TadD|uniref:Sporulation related n=1 Tax=Sphingopyxis alaskensis (strain DSM 13593 / LMG 18877 / RB2256) TaxID=317655 RepID=Q1GRV2_SPHAL|nr:SPOR domain-containing protein [Sphingopyxis alaskensis]ABF53620.1 Sporulation related [Sphingopyxis alaskensis RB2256]MCM3419109.1 SPOR domain-containing protein [Sphingopyxis alaskensis]
MNRKMLMNLAVSGFVLGVATGCSGMGKMADAPSRAAGTPAVAAKSADKARVALEEGKPGKAVALAEAAVAASPRDAGYRALLGQAYLGDGRFASASAALAEAMELGANDSNTILSFALAEIAQGRNGDAVALLTRHRDAVSASDLGLALALAGDSEGSLYVLGQAARAEGADARTRQNLALALALSGRWAQARIVASQDLSLAKLEGRMAEWSKLAEQPNAQVRVASLIGTSAQPDAGMPVRLALRNFADMQMAAAEPASTTPVQVASADPAPVADYAPPPPMLADAGNSIRSVELPMPERTAAGVVPVTELPQPAPAAQIILADATPYRHAPRVAGEGHIRPAQKQALELATVMVPKAMGFDARKPDGWAVQLGAYDSLAIAKEKWGTLKKRNAILGGFPASSHTATIKGRTFYRLTVNGLASRADASSLCNQLRTQGQPCFIRAMGGSESIQWAAKAGPMRLASR